MSRLRNTMHRENHKVNKGKSRKNERDLTDFPRQNENERHDRSKMKGDLRKIENVSGWLDKNSHTGGWTPNLEILDQSPDHGSWIRSSQDLSRLMSSSTRPYFRIFDLKQADGGETQEDAGKVCKALHSPQRQESPVSHWRDQFELS